MKLHSIVLTVFVSIAVIGQLYAQPTNDKDHIKIELESILVKSPTNYIDILREIKPKPLLEIALVATSLSMAAVMRSMNVVGEVKDDWRILKKDFNVLKNAKNFGSLRRAALSAYILTASGTITLASTVAISGGFFLGMKNLLGSKNK